MTLWRYLEDGLCDGPANMAADFALLRALNEGLGRPTLRLYGWARPTLSVGYAQDAGADFDLPALERAGIPVVRRPTGGRGVLHVDELTYCLVAPIPHARFPAGLKAAYRSVAEILLLFLETFGVSASVAPECRAPAVRSPDCFALANHFEIVAGAGGGVGKGGKLIGSAQRRLTSAFLQHGSIPLAPRPAPALENFLLCPLAGSGPAGETRRITLSEAAGRKVEWAEAAANLLSAFTKFIGAAPERSLPGAREMLLRQEALRDLLPPA